MVALEGVTLGTTQDLDGAPSDQVSMSDLAFHAMREYVRGDDLRHVHWRSSARAGQLHVRQYHDSRRSRALVLVDDDAAAYPGPDAFELAVSVAASVLVRLAAASTTPPWCAATTGSSTGRSTTCSTRPAGSRPAPPETCSPPVRTRRRSSAGRAWLLVTGDRVIRIGSACCAPPTPALPS